MRRRVLVTGGSGFIGGALVRALLDRGELVTVLSRNVNAARRAVPREARVALWTPGKPGPWTDELSVVDAVIHLAGAPVAKRWTPEHKKRIEQSRVESTRLIAEAIGAADKKPELLISASGIGYYGTDRPGEELTEDSEPGNDFLAKLSQRWEEAARQVEEHGVRAVQTRIGVVLGPGGGALAKMVMPLRLGVSAIGAGDNKVSWIHRDDVVGMMLWALDNDELSGPINATSPFVTTGREMAEAIGSVLGRPVLPVPAAVLKMALGEAVDMLTGSIHAVPQVALDKGYEYHYARLVPALEDALMSEERVTLAS